MKRYKQLAKEDTVRYQAELENFINMLNELRQSQQHEADSYSTPKREYKQTPEHLQFQAEFPTPSAQGPKTPSSHDEGFMVRTSSCKKPKKPLSAYIFYSQEQREIVKKKYPSWSTKEVMKYVSSNWQSLPRHQKDKYAILANQDKRRFDQELRDLRNARVAGLPSP